LQHVDLVLLHAPCEYKFTVKDPAASNNALWTGLQKALSANLTRAIGVSNYKVKQLQELNGPVPSLNQCEMSVNGSFMQPAHDDGTCSSCYFLSSCCVLF